ncbi:minor capsid protein [Heliobacterium chlorum]|uniref:Minor capsid protein n=1 Tax=Heliobacterium chlorum TaxID=2698 RepID=A0ABR7SYD2_HELCL|nr:polymorphic toxin type 50 domain-containing protein [Heliobacterium chlorum]MBC9783539.1 minor capsid protein [Heliobacterium chlorum]
MATPIDIDAIEKLHDGLNRKLATWEKKKLKALLAIFKQAETEIKAKLATVENWEKTRLEGILQDIDRICDTMTVNAEAWVRGRSDVPISSPLAPLSLQAIKLGADAGMAALGIKAGFTMVHMPAISYLQDYQLDLIRKVSLEVKQQIREQLQLGYIQGESIPDIAKRLRNTKLDKGIWPLVEKRAVVVARTEILRASNQGAKFVYESYGVKRVKWLTAADERVCKVCGPLHRKLFPIDKIPFGGPPAHPRCRCFIVPDIATSEEEGKIADALANENTKAFKADQLQKLKKQKEKKESSLNEAERARSDIIQGKYKLKINANKQNKHLEGTKEYNDYASSLALKGDKPSVLNAHLNPQEIVHRFAGTGRIIVQSKGRPPKEKIKVNDMIVGKYYNKDKGEFVDTSSILVVYSRTGIHMYPVGDDENDQVKSTR